MGTVDIGKEALDRFAAGSGTIGTTPDHLPDGLVCKHVVVRANGGNAGIVIVGHSQEAVADGFILSAGQMTPPVHVNDRNKVWLVADQAGQGYSWISS